MSAQLPWPWRGWLGLQHRWWRKLHDPRGARDSGYPLCWPNAGMHWPWPNSLHCLSGKNITDSFQEIYQVLLIITILQTWGVGDAYFEAGGNPFLFDTVNEPKLSYFSVVDALLNTTDAMKNWWEILIWQIYRNSDFAMKNCMLCSSIPVSGVRRSKYIEISISCLLLILTHVSSSLISRRVQFFDKQAWKSQL